MYNMPFYFGFDSVCSSRRVSCVMHVMLGRTTQRPNCVRRTWRIKYVHTQTPYYVRRTYVQNTYVGTTVRNRLKFGEMEIWHFLHRIEIVMFLAQGFCRKTQDWLFSGNMAPRIYQFIGARCVRSSESISITASLQQSSIYSVPYTVYS